MNRDRKRERRRNVFSILGLLALLMYILQLWPVLVLILSGMVVYVFWLLFHLEKETVQPAPPMPPPAPPKPDVPVSEETVLNSAFVLLQRRITEQVTKQYPEGRWIWSVSNARERFANGEALRIMLNRAGGYQSALVQVHNLQFCGLDYATSEHLQEPNSTELEEAQDAAPKQESVDYGLLAFEWVDANLQGLNVRCNEVIAQGQDSFRIPAEQLPHGDSWPNICTELIRNGFAAAEPLADGILVQIKSQ